VTATIRQERRALQLFWTMNIIAGSRTVYKARTGGRPWTTLAGVRFVAIFVFGTLLAAVIFFLGLLVYGPFVLLVEFYADTWWHWKIPEIIFWPPYFLLCWVLGLKKVYSFFANS
jgi:hypothetical protein